MAKKTVKKAARKQAKTQARRPVRRTSPKPKRAKKAKQIKTKAKTRAKAKAASKPVKKAAAKRIPVKTRKVVKPMAATPKAAKPMAAKPKAAKTMKKAPPKPVARVAPPKAAPPTLQRVRRRLPEAEDESQAFTDVSEDSRLMNSARAGHDELRSELKRHTESSPAMTAGDVDAKWQDAYALGDEAPGGDNMTPDQDRVDDIGKALGIEYADDEELLGGTELVERDEHRWELDPASKEEDEDL